MYKEQMVKYFELQHGTPEERICCDEIRAAFIATASVCAEKIENFEEREYAIRKLKEALQAAIGGIVAPLTK